MGQLHCLLADDAHAVRCPPSNPCPPCPSIHSLLQTEEEWEAARDATVQQQAAAAHAEACKHPLPNLLALERRLGQLLDKAMPVRAPRC